MSADDCPLAHLHTPLPPHCVSFMGAWSWANAMLNAGARQKRCPGCGLWKVWTKPTRPLPWEKDA